MSTRSVIRVIGTVGCEDIEVNLYHHHDGYLEGVGFDLLDMFYKNGELKFGFIENVVNNLIKKENDEYEWTPYSHTDIEYFYILDVDNNRITAQRVNNLDDEMEVYQTWDTEDLIGMYKKNREVVDIQ